MPRNLYLHVPDPFDSSTGARLKRMGVQLPDGEVDAGTMQIFARIFAGLFFDDLCDFYSDQTQLDTVMAAFSELTARGDHQNVYLLISLQYDTIRKPLPDPVWWLAGCAPALSLFCRGFVEHLLTLMQDPNNKMREARACEAADRCTG